MPPSIDNSVKVESSPSTEEFPPTLYPLRDIEKPESVEPITGGWQEGIPIAIDLGSYHTRIGYASESKPSHEFYTQVAKYRDRRANRSYTLVGNDIYLDSTARQNIKSPFDGTLLSNWDVVETIFDYSFAKMSVGSNNGVENPVVLTEIIGNPEPQRKFMNELLFEGYNLPSVAYGIDSLFSFRYNQGPKISDHSHTGIVISCGHEATYITPVLKGRGILSQSKRINWGGKQASSYLQSLLALKYPYFPSRLSPSQATCMVHDHCYISPDYPEEVSNYLDYSTMSNKERIIQAPFTEVVVQEKSEEELARIAEQRKESGRRLQEQAAKKRLEKLVQQEQELEYYNNLRNKITDAPNKKEAKRLLDSDGFKDEATLQKTINDLEKTVRRGRKQDIGDDAEEAPPTFPLVEIPDEDLDEDQIKEKRRQRLLKASYDARIRAKEEKLLEEKRLEEEARKDAEWREKDLEGWIKDKRERLEGILANVREKQRLREELSNRKSLASQMRMKSIAALASDSRSGGKRRRAAAGTTGDDDPDDTFGANDDDWAVYRRIANASDSEEEEEEKSIIKTLQNQLLEHDSTFSIEDTREAQMDWRKSTIHMFLRGPHEFDPESRAQSHQINLNVERIRVPEVLFQPSIAGVDQAGIVEISGDILLRNPTMGYANNIFLHGGQASFPNFEDRLYRELRSILPVDTPLSVKRASNLSYDAWRGMAQWSVSDEFKSSVITRQDYLEMGGGYIKEHGLGNALVR